MSRTLVVLLFFSSVALGQEHKMDPAEQMSLARWGMSLVAVQTLFPDGKLVGNDWVCEREMHGKPAALLLHILKGKLRGFTLTTGPLPEQEVLEMYQLERESLIRGYGQPQHATERWGDKNPNVRGIMVEWKAPDRLLYLSAFRRSRSILAFTNADPSLSQSEFAALMDKDTPPQASAAAH